DFLRFTLINTVTPTENAGMTERTIFRISQKIRRHFRMGLMVIVLAQALLILIGHVNAEPQTRTFYNDRGQVTGQATTRGNTTTFSNDKGQSVGRSERRGDATYYYNDKGQMIGTSRGPAR